MTDKVKIIELLRKASECLLEINKCHPSEKVVKETSHIYVEVLNLIEIVRKEMSENE